MEVNETTGALMIQRLKESDGQPAVASVSLREWRRMSAGDKAQVQANYRAKFGEEDPSTVKAG